MVFGKHGREWHEVPLVDRYSIPIQLGISIAQAMMVYFAAHPMVLHDNYEEASLATVHKSRWHKSLLLQAAGLRRDARKITVDAKR